MMRGPRLSVVICCLVVLDISEASLLVAISQRSGQMFSIPTTELELSSPLDVHNVDSPSFVEADLSTPLIYWTDISSKNKGFIGCYIYSTHGETVLTELSFGARVVGLALDGRRSLAYYADANDGSIVAVNTDTGVPSTVIRGLNTSSLCCLAVNRRTGELYWKEVAYVGVSESSREGIYAWKYQTVDSGLVPVKRLLYSEHKSLAIQAVAVETTGAYVFWCSTGRDGAQALLKYDLSGTAIFNLPFSGIQGNCTSLTADAVFLYMMTSFENGSNAIYAIPLQGSTTHITLLRSEAQTYYKDIAVISVPTALTTLETPTTAAATTAGTGCLPSATYMVPNGVLIAGWVVASTLAVVILIAVPVYVIRKRRSKRRSKRRRSPLALTELTSSSTRQLQQLTSVSPSEPQPSEQDLSQQSHNSETDNIYINSGVAVDTPEEYVPPDPEVAREYTSMIPRTGEEHRYEQIIENTSAAASSVVGTSNSPEATTAASSSAPSRASKPQARVPCPLPRSTRLKPDIDSSTGADKEHATSIQASAGGTALFVETDVCPQIPATTTCVVPSQLSTGPAGGPRPPPEPLGVLPCCNSSADANNDFAKSDLTTVATALPVTETGVCPKTQAATTSPVSSQPPSQPSVGSCLLPTSLVTTPTLASPIREPTGSDSTSTLSAPIVETDVCPPTPASTTCLVPIQLPTGPARGPCPPPGLLGVMPCCDSSVDANSDFAKSDGTASSVIETGVSPKTQASTTSLVPSQPQNQLQ